MAQQTATQWSLKGTGYEFCNCDFGCGCNFGGFPNSKDGSCRALVGCDISEGSCGDVDLSGVKCAAMIVWPKAIHEGNGKAVFAVDPATTDAQVNALAQIFTGQLGGLPWELLGPTFEVAGLVKGKVTFEGTGTNRRMAIEGFGEGRGSAFRNPVTGDEHMANVELPDGFIWKHGQCGQGSFHAEASGVSVKFDKTNWILYSFDWSNAATAAAA